MATVNIFHINLCFRRPKAGGGYSQSIIVQSDSRIGNNPSSIYLQNRFSIRIKVFNSCLVLHHLHIPVFNQISKAIQSRTRTCQQHTAILGESILHKIRWNIYGQYIVE